MGKEKEERLFAVLRSCGTVAVALSGGIDSAVLLMAAVRALGKRNVIAVTAASELLSSAEIADAKRCAAFANVRWKILPADDLSSPDIVRNDERRCYYCKKRRFEMLVAWAKEQGFLRVLDGTNADDIDDYRPGLVALKELAPVVLSPLKEAQWTKRDIRKAAKAWCIPIWSKPSAACLASRIEYGITLTKERLHAVEAAEDALRRYISGQIRVRCHGKLSRIEIEPFEFDTFWQHREELEAAVRAAGFTYVTLDLCGYRMGSPNEALHTLSGE